MYSSKHTEAIRREPIVRRMTDIVRKADPTARLVLYGSRARGDHRESSDWDVLVLLDRDRITEGDHAAISYPFWDLAFETNQEINPTLYTKAYWDKTSFSMFHHNVENDGIDLL